MKDEKEGPPITGKPRDLDSVDEGVGMKDEKDESHLASEKTRDLKDRLREYALRIIRLYDSLPKHGAVHVITYQLVRSGTAPGAHYREACRSKSNADFISKMEGGLQELDESDYWLDLLAGAGFAPIAKLQPLITETNELIAIFVPMVLKAKSRNKK